MWRREIEELERRKAIAYGLGGVENVQKQHDHGKMTVRERIHALCDTGTFRERGAQKSGLRLSWRYAWPSAVWGNIPVEGGVYAAHRREIESSDDPKACLEKLQETYRAISSPFRTAEAFGIEDIIDPRDTRSLLCEWVEMAYKMEQTHLGPKRRGMRC